VLGLPLELGDLAGKTSVPKGKKSARAWSEMPTVDKGQMCRVKVDDEDAPVT